MLSRDLILHNFWLKLSSLILASLIWFTVFATQKDIKFSRNPITPSDRKVFAHVPVHIKARPGEQRLFKVSRSEVKVSIKGTPANLKNLGVQDVHAMIDLTQLGEVNGVIEKVQVFSPDGTTADSVDPMEVWVEVQTGSNAPAIPP